MENMEKVADQTIGLIKSGKLAEAAEAIEAASVEYVRTQIREESFIERLIPGKTVSSTTKGLIKLKNREVFAYRMPIEQGGVAMEVGVRAESLGRFVDGKEFDILIGKIETEEIMKSKIELEVAGSLLEMVKVNSVNQVGRVQDTAGMRVFRWAVEKDLPGYETRTLYADWSDGPDKQDLISLKNIISRMELKPRRWVHSDIFESQLDVWQQDDVGDLTKELITTGFPGKEVLRMERMSTSKTQLADPLWEWDTDNPNSLENSLNNDGMYFDWIIPGDGVYTAVWLMVDPEFLGKIIRYEGDTVWSEWKKHIYHWQMWRYWGIGLGDFRGLARLIIKLQDLSV